MTRLLVSVRDAAEARTAVEAGVDLIDVKEPRHGSLGRASDAVVADVLQAVAGRAPVSAALGELRDWDQQCSGVSPKPRMRVSEKPAYTELSFAKLGLAGCATLTDWPQRWDTALRSIVPPPRAVAVIYADWRTAHAPSPVAVLDEARRFGCGAVLVDTYDKHAGGLLAHWRLHEVATLINQAHAVGMLAVIAGSLDRDSIPQIAPLAPDYVAVRGAVCRGGRTNSIDRELIEQLRRCLSTSSARARSDEMLDTTADYPNTQKRIGNSEAARHVESL